VGRPPSGARTASDRIQPSSWRHSSQNDPGLRQPGPLLAVHLARGERARQSAVGESGRQQGGRYPHRVGDGRVKPASVSAAELTAHCLQRMGSTDALTDRQRIARSVTPQVSSGRPADPVSWWRVLEEFGKVSSHRARPRTPSTSSSNIRCRSCCMLCRAKASRVSHVGLDAATEPKVTPPSLVYTPSDLTSERARIP